MEGVWDALVAASALRHASQSNRAAGDCCCYSDKYIAIGVTGEDAVYLGNDQNNSHSKTKNKRDRLTDQSDSTAAVFIGVITWCAFFFYINDQLMVLR